MRFSFLLETNEVPYALKATMFVPFSSTTSPFRPKQQVRVKIDASCAGKACDSLSNRDAQARSSENEWCEVLLAQHVPQGAYIDVDEVKVRYGASLLASAYTTLRWLVFRFSVCPALHTWPR